MNLAERLKSERSYTN